MTDLSLSRSQMLLLSGSANRALAEEVAAHLGQPLCQVTLRRFADGELFVKIDENVRGRDVYIIQPTNPPAENMMELLLLMDAARRASAARVTAVIPYFGYARQDRKDQPRVAISAKLMANMVSHGRRGPGAGDGLPPAPAAGVLRPAGRSPLRGAGVREPLPAEAAARPGRGGPRRRLGQDGPRLRQAAQRIAGDHRQAAAVGQRRRGAERRRRGGRSRRASSPTT